MAIIDLVKKIYIKMPLSVINMIAPIYYMVPQSIRYGSTFERQRKNLNKQEYLNKEEIDKLVNNEFIELVNYCYNNVPYYRELFDREGIDVKSFKDKSDIVKIPFLTKDILRENKDKLVAKNVDKNKLQLITTSGSTGTPLGLYVDSDNTMKEWAYTLHLWKRVGYMPDSSRLVLRGKYFREQILRGKNWQYDALRRELSCNIFDMCDKNLEEYCKAIEKYKPEFVHGYTSAIQMLCNYIEKRESGIRHKFKAVLAVSENVTDFQREYIESVLETRVFSFYGHSERLVMAGECENSTEYHVEPLYGIAEIIDSEGNVVDGLETGELVTTGFCNKGMPLLRYKTGDMASWSTDKTCLCGRKSIKINKVRGRKQEVLINSENKIVPFTAISYDFFHFNVKKYQFYQENIGKVILRIVPDDNFSKKDEMKIVEILEGETRGKIKYTIQIVNEIPLRKNGKQQLVIQKLEYNN